MRLRRVDQSDLETIRLLRNRNRAAFFDVSEVSPEQQHRWFEALKTRPVDFYVIEEDERVVGTISVTTTAAGREIGNLIIDEPYRGRGLMRGAINQVTAAPGRYFCCIRVGNEPSMRVFSRSGFAPESVCLAKTVAPVSVPRVNAERG